LDIISKFKKLMIDLGANKGVHSLRRTFKRMDANGSNTVSRAELKEGLEEFGLSMSNKDLARLFRYLDRNDSDAINIDEFMAGIRAGMSYERKSMVRNIWDRIDRNHVDGVKFDEMRRYHDFKHHPEVLDGLVTESEAEEIFCEHFSEGARVGGNVTWHEFLDYYKSISAIVEDDYDFELILRNSWSVPLSPRSVSSATTQRRVLVTHDDGSQEVHA
jgi:Ca2+-binding EF-hand superfamily protein